MKSDYTDINIIQDKSGSMWPLRNETIGGFNTFIEDQRKTPGCCTITLTQFNTEFRIVHKGVDVSSVPPLTPETYSPGGMTALLDAIAKTIQETGARLEAMPEADRPARVIVVVTTDGEENSSREFSGTDGRSKVMAMIKEQTERYNWQFIFLGANQDAIQAGGSVGVRSANAMSAGVTGQAIKSSYAAVSGNIANYRCAAPSDVDKLAFTKKQREDQLKQGAAKDALNS